MSKQSRLTVHELLKELKRIHLDAHPSIEKRVVPRLFMVGIYHNLLSLNSELNSQSRTLQIELINEIETLLPNVKHSLPISWINFTQSIREIISAVTADYSFGIRGEGVRADFIEVDEGELIDVVSFWFLNPPIYESTVTNYRLHLEREIQSVLIRFWPEEIDAGIPGKLEIFELVYKDTLGILLGRQNLENSFIDRYQILSHLLYTMMDIHFSGLYSKLDCSQLAWKLRQLIVDGVEGGEPNNSSQGEIGLALLMSSGLDSNKARKLHCIKKGLDDRQCTVSIEDDTLLIWQYPNKEQQWRVTVNESELIDLVSPDGAESQWSNPSDLCLEIHKQLEYSG